MSTTYNIAERTMTEIIADLSKEIPNSLLKTKPTYDRQGNKTGEVVYVPWHQATRLLDHYAPGWDYTIKEVKSVNGDIVITVSLTITASDGVATREATGFEKDDKYGYGDPYSNATSMALRRACAVFGLGRYLYRG